MIYRHPVRIEFNHCDPAGIVFYPRYFEMTNSVAENFFREVAGYSYAEMMKAFSGVPTARLEADFKKPSRLGEVLEWQVRAGRFGETSLELFLAAVCDGDVRVSVRKILVFVSGETGAYLPMPWPQIVRDRISAAINAASEGK